VGELIKNFRNTKHFIQFIVINFVGSANVRIFSNSPPACWQASLIPSLNPSFAPSTTLRASEGHSKERGNIKNFTDLKNNRKLVLKMADWIIPGHGKMFKVNK